MADREYHVKHEVSVLIVGDDLSSVDRLGEGLSSEGCLCELVLNRESAIDIVRRAECDVVVCDVQMQGTYNFELLERFKAIQPNLPVIVATSSGAISEAVEAVKRGAYQYLEKPLDIEELLKFIIHATSDSHKLRRTVRPPPVVADSLVGDLVQESACMKELVATIELVARSSAAVLIVGESGTGKERVARAIHAGGARANQPFIAVNTSAIPDALLESEVFGHVRGAFTGATQARRGLLQEANGGTLLLDEIGDMPLALQPKLLRVLQFGESRAVGSDRFGSVDVRVIAATHRDLSKLVAEGTFREDLRYRLNVIPLTIPPLRDRRADITPLVAQFLQDAKTRTVESPVNSFSDEAMRVLQLAPWPGNVRELENTVERLVVLGRGTEITENDVGFLREQSPTESCSAAEGTSFTLKEMNRRYLDSVLVTTGGDKVRAAGILDIDLSTLYRWVRAKP